MVESWQNGNRGICIVSCCDPRSIENWASTVILFQQNQKFPVKKRSERIIFFVFFLLCAACCVHFNWIAFPVSCFQFVATSLATHESDWVTSERTTRKDHHRSWSKDYYLIFARIALQPQHHWALIVVAVKLVNLEFIKLFAKMLVALHKFACIVLLMTLNGCTPFAFIGKRTNRGSGHIVQLAEKQTRVFRQPAGTDLMKLRATEHVSIYEELQVPTLLGIYLVDITPDIRRIVAASGIDSGVVTILSRHTTTAITINEMEGRLVDDTRQFLLKLVPAACKWRDFERYVEFWLLSSYTSWLLDKGGECTLLIGQSFNIVPLSYYHRHLIV